MYKMLSMQSSLFSVINIVVFSMLMSGYSISFRASVMHDDGARVEPFWLDAMKFIQSHFSMLLYVCLCHAMVVTCPLSRHVRLGRLVREALE